MGSPAEKHGETKNGTAKPHDHRFRLLLKGLEGKVQLGANRCRGGRRGPNSVPCSGGGRRNRRPNSYPCRDNESCSPIVSWRFWRAGRKGAGRVGHDYGHLATADLGLVAVIVNDIGETRINTNTVTGIQLHIVRGLYKPAAVVD